MWYRIEGNTGMCTCGEVNEKWVRFSGAKPILRISYCPTCWPHLVDLVRRWTSNSEDADEVAA